MEFLKRLLGRKDKPTPISHGHDFATKMLLKPGSIRFAYRRIDVLSDELVKTVKDYKHKKYSIAEKRFDGVILTKGSDVVEIVPRFAMSYLDDEFNQL